MYKRTKTFCQLDQRVFDRPHMPLKKYRGCHAERSRSISAYQSLKAKTDEIPPVFLYFFNFNNLQNQNLRYLLLPNTLFRLLLLK